MSERWRKKLGDLDKVGPDDEVFDRAQIGPEYPEDPIERPSTGARIVTAVAAFTVFALAIAVFAIPALRLKEGAGEGIGDSTMLPLWPVQTLDEAQAMQADADAGGDATRFTDPERAAEVFGHDVLGWNDVTTYAIDDNGASSCLNWRTGGNEATVGCGVTWDVTEGGYDYATPTMGPTSGGPSPFRTVEILRCTSNVCPGGVATTQAMVTLFQPIRHGVGGVWMVLDAQGPFTQVSGRPGAQLGFGETVSAVAMVPEGSSGVLGIRVGTPGSDCTALATTERFDSQTPTQTLGTMGSVALAIPQPLGADGQPCGDGLPAYAFTAVVHDASDLATFDPIAGAAGVSVESFTALPFIALDLNEKPTETATGIFSEMPPTVAPSAASPAPVGDAVMYETNNVGHYGLDVPIGWTALDFSYFDTRVTYTGTIVSNVAFPAAIPDDPRSVPLGDAEVRLTLEHRDGGPAPDLTSDDHGFPLLTQAIKPADRLDLPFRANGIDWIATVEAGPDAPQQALDAMFAVVASLTFPELVPGERVDGWTALYPANKPVDWQNITTNVIVVMTPGKGRVALDTVDTCGEGQNMTSDAAGDAIIECPDGSVIGYSADGQPLPGNPAGYRDALDVHPVITAWNGRLLTQLGGTVAVAV